MQLKMPRSCARPLGLASVGLFASLVASGIGCSASKSSGGTFDGQGNAPGAGGTGASVGAGGSSGTGIIDQGGSSGASGGSGDAGMIDPDASCANDLQTAGLKEVAMLVMFDRSGSMTQNQVSPTQNRWQAASAALNLFFQDSGSAGMRVALRFFPHNTPAAGCSNGSSECNAQACSQPLVDIAMLTADPAPTDAHEAALVNAVNTSAPGGGNNNGGGTPTYAALSGAEIWAVAYQAAHPNEQTVVVFVSDGEPNGCDENTNSIAALATAPRTQGVLTYAVGMQDGANVLNAIAQAGGTMQAIMVEDGMAQSALLTALQNIRGQVLACNFAMPTPKVPSQPIDPTKININYTPSGGTQTLIGGVANEAACTTTGGWYYDNPAAPTQITLCPESCKVVQGDVAPKIEILIGCSILPPPPPS